MSDPLIKQAVSQASVRGQIQVVGRFKVHALARYLSHAELLRIFQRACVRADLGLRYSQGFNPRPKISLPLPKSVGMESEGDLVCFYLNDTQFSDFGSLCEQIRQKLSEQLPQGISLCSVALSPVSTRWHPTGAAYVIPVKTDLPKGPLGEAIHKITADETLKVVRKTKTGGIKNIHVKNAIRAVEWAPEGLLVRYNVHANGSIRLNEILNLLGLETDQLDGPVRRTAIQWQQT